MTATKLKTLTCCLLLLLAMPIITGCAKNIRDVPVKEYFKKDFKSSDYSGSLTREELDLVLAYRMTAISSPQVLEDETPVGKIIEKMRREMLQNETK